MKDIYRVRRHIEKDLINRLIKNNRKLEFERLWFQFSKRTLSKGIDKSMYRVYLEQKVLEGKLIFNKDEDSFSLAEEISRENFRANKDEEIGYWNELSKLLSEFENNYKKLQNFFHMDPDMRQDHFDKMKELNSSNQELIKQIAEVTVKYNLGLKFLENRLPKSAFKELKSFRNNR